MTASCTKLVEVPTDWLTEIDDMTVVQAIEYLQTLNPTHRLTYSVTAADTTDLEVTSNLYYDVLLTPDEVLAEERAKLEKRRQRALNTVSYWEGLLANGLTIPNRVNYARYCIEQATDALEEIDRRRLILNEANPPTGEPS